MDEMKTLIARYCSQQIELGMPDPIFSKGFNASFLARVAPAPAIVPQIGKSSAPSATQMGKPKLFTPVDSTAKAARTKPLTNLSHYMVPADEKAMEINEEKREELKKIDYEFKLCHQCPLGKRRKHFVFGSGNVDAPLLVIGEAPGADEDEQGLPFVGRAGKLLTEMLSAIGLDRQKNVFITNILKCRPPENRQPAIEEIAACIPLLHKQIAIMKPKAILLLGGTAAHALLDSVESVGILRERTHTYNGIPAMVTYHPSYLLRSPENKRPAWEDLKKLKNLLIELKAYGT